MTITTTEEFRDIGRRDGRSLGLHWSEPHMVFDPPNGPDHVAYLEGVIAGARSVIAVKRDGLTLTIERELDPKEITYMVFGTGALTYPWWGDVQWISVVDGEEFPIDDYADLDTAEPDDVLIFTHDNGDSPEGAMDQKTRVTFREIAAAAGLAILKGYVYEADAIKEDLGLLDAEQADTVLQLAVLKVDKPVFG